MNEDQEFFAEVYKTANLNRYGGERRAQEIFTHYMKEKYEYEKKILDDLIESRAVVEEGTV